MATVAELLEASAAGVWVEFFSAVAEDVSVRWQAKKARLKAIIKKGFMLFRETKMLPLNRKPRQLLAPRFDCGPSTQIRRQIRRGKRFHVHLHQADKWTTIVGTLAAAAINEDTDSGDGSAVTADDVDCFLDAAAAGDDVLGHDKPLVRPDLKTPPEDEAAGLFFGEDVPFAKRTAYFLSNYDAAQGRGNDTVALQ